MLKTTRLAAIAGHDPTDSASPTRAVDDSLADLKRGVKGLELTLIRHFYTHDMVADDEMAADVENAAICLAGLGAEVTEIHLPPLEQYAACNSVILLSEA